MLIRASELVVTAEGVGTTPRQTQGRPDGTHHRTPFGADETGRPFAAVCNGDGLVTPAVSSGLYSELRRHRHDQGDPQTVEAACVRISRLTGCDIDCDVGPDSMTSTYKHGPESGRKSRNRLEEPGKLDMLLALVVLPLAILACASGAASQVKIVNQDARAFTVVDSLPRETVVFVDCKIRNEGEPTDIRVVARLQTELLQGSLRLPSETEKTIHIERGVTETVTLELHTFNLRYIGEDQTNVQFLCELMEPRPPMPTPTPAPTRTPSPTPTPIPSELLEAFGKIPLPKDALLTSERRRSRESDDSRYWPSKYGDAPKYGHTLLREEVYEASVHSNRSPEFADLVEFIEANLSDWSLEARNVGTPTSDLVYKKDHLLLRYYFHHPSGNFSVYQCVALDAP